MTTTEPERLEANAAVAAYAVPHNRGGCQVTAGHKGGEPFEMNIQFSSTGTNVCANGEYRQWVRGTFQWKQNSGDAWTTLVHAMRGHNLSPDTYYEDSTPGGAAYGHRGYNGFTDDYYTDADWTTRNRAAGCYYHGTDFPGITSDAGTYYRLALDFRGAAVDATDGDTVLQESTWSVACEGQL